MVGGYCRDPLVKFAGRIAEIELRGVTREPHSKAVGSKITK